MTAASPDRNDSDYWVKWFKRNAARSPSSDAPDRLTERERALISPSIRQFELGERAEGRSLLSRATQFATETGDPGFVDAIRLFIEEENRHSANLRRFMTLHGIACIERCVTDGVFRRLRKLAGLELMVMVLVAAEVVAMSYYRALRDATGSSLLKGICEEILREEVSHLKFQGQTLRKLRQHRGRLRRAFSETFHALLMAVILPVVWLEHGSVYRAGGFTFRRFVSKSMRCLMKVIEYSRGCRTREAVSPCGRQSSTRRAPKSTMRSR